MSRKVILTIAAAASLAVSALPTNSTYARGFGGMGGGGHAFAGGSGSGNHAFARTGGGSSGHSSSSLGKGRNSGGLHQVRGDKPGRGRHGHPIVTGHLHPHHHLHWVLRGDRWIEIDDNVDVDDDTSTVDAAPASVPGPCTCLTKTYTPAGLVVFADVCTKESVSAPASGDTSDATQAPSTTVPANATPMAQVPTTPNYAGRTYQDYLAANPQAAQPQASSQTPDQSSSDPQQN